ncbi:MAG TPA: hypothetical protein VKS82_25315 [Streptosporangiaceae bacterium]|nr:hypothetical protein [Streptosporangiaceae bacterium]
MLARTVTAMAGTAAAATAMTSLSAAPADATTGVTDWLTPGFLSVSRSAGSFTITSTSPADASEVAWMLTTA